MSLDFLKYLRLRGDSYVNVWVHLVLELLETGKPVDYALLLHRFKISRSSLQRIVDYGCGFSRNGQSLGRVWAGKTIQISNLDIVCGQSLGRVWAESTDHIGPMVDHHPHVGHGLGIDLATVKHHPPLDIQGTIAPPDASIILKEVLPKRDHTHLLKTATDIKANNDLSTAIRGGMVQHPGDLPVPPVPISPPSHPDNDGVPGASSAGTLGTTPEDSGGTTGAPPKKARKTSSTKKNLGDPSQYKRFVDRYYTFVRAQKSEPNMNAVQGNALKSIIEYLGKRVDASDHLDITQSRDTLVYDLWDQILSRWSELPPHLQSVNLPRINLNLPDIIIQLNKKQHGNKSTGEQQPRTDKYSDSIARISDLRFG